MKEFALKHPIITFLLVDGIITGLFNTIRAFAPNGGTQDTDESEATEEDEAVCVAKEEEE